MLRAAVRDSSLDISGVVGTAAEAEVGTYHLVERIGRCGRSV